MSKNLHLVTITGGDSQTNVATWLANVPDELAVGKHTFKFLHNVPATLQPFRESGYHCQAEFMLITDGSDTIKTEVQQLAGGRCIVVNRPYKPEMLVDLFKPAKEYDIEVFLPISLGTVDTEIYQLGKVDIPDWMTHVIVKPMGGARGETQAIIPIDQYGVWASDERDLTPTQLMKRYPEVKHFWGSEHKNDDGTLADKPGFTKSAFMTVPYVDNVICEFRLLRGGDDYVAYIRTRADINGELRVATSDTQPVLDSHYPDYELDMAKLRADYNLNFSKLMDYLDDVGFLYGSVDFYIREVGDERKLGIFECCPQHGTTYMRVDTQRRLAKGFLEHCCRKWIDEYL